MNTGYFKEKVGVVNRKLTEFKNFFRAIKQEEVILIYQMGKVGSSSLYYSLNKQVKKPVIHVHNFYIVKEDTPFFRKSYIKFKIAFLNYILKNKRLKVVTFVREPVSRNLSCFFQNLDRYIDVNERDPQVIIEAFEKKYDHNYPLIWIDEELNKKFKIDIYKEEFNKEKGFKIIDIENGEIFLGKLEKLNTYKDELKKFLNVDFEFLNYNEGDKKWYSDVYINVKKEFSPSSEYLKKMYNSKYVNYFYTDEEISRFISKYKKTNI